MPLFPKYLLPLRRLRQRLGIGVAGVGLALGVAAYMLFAAQDSAIKWLVSGRGGMAVPVWQILFVRSLFIAASAALAGGRPMLHRATATPVKGKLVARGLITLVAWLCFYSSARTLPLAQMLTVYFSAPIIATVLAGPVLGEHVPPSRWACVLLGFAGVVVACDPGGFGAAPGTGWAIGLALSAAVLWGLAIILMRQIARDEATPLQMFYTNVIMMAGTGLGCALDWHPLHRPEITLLALICAVGTIGQVCLFEGARRAPASMMATVEYSALLWAFILGFVVFGDIPRPAVFAGAGLILGAGALLLATERRTLLRPA